ncbi:uncharacterized protein [Brachionichthys hirsutus]|uniref:uncharacterized protein n=1 Tax=Brachionichthys hirsutus TaxID=412623 RepID=UPI0036054014
MSNIASPPLSLSQQGSCDDASTLHHLPVSVSEHAPPSAAEKLESNSPGAIEETSAPQPSICCSRPTRPGPFNVRSASATAAPGPVNRRPGLEILRPVGAASAPSAAPGSPVKKDSETTLAAKAGPAAWEPQKPQESQGQKGVGAPEAKQPQTGSERPPAGDGRGRVAQLMKTFSTETPTDAPPRGVKPPLPTKPSHLRPTAAPTVR